MYKSYDFYMMPIHFVTTILIVASIYFPLKNKSANAKRISLIAIIVIMLILEVVKQIVALQNPAGFDFFSLPLHISSIPLLTFSLAVFFKPNSKISQLGYALSLCIGVCISVALYLTPNLIIGWGNEGIFYHGFDTVFLNWHNVIYHNLVVIFTILLFMFKLYRPNIKHFYYSTGILCLINIIISLIANFSNVNFAKLLTTNFFVNGASPLIMFLDDLIWVTGFTLVIALIGFLVIVLPILREKRQKLNEQILLKPEIIENQENEPVLIQIEEKN